MAKKTAIGIDLGTTYSVSASLSRFCVFAVVCQSVCQNSWILCLQVWVSRGCVGVWKNDGVEIIANDQGNRTTEIDEI